MRFLFWNVKKNPVSRILSEVVKAREVDVVILAESVEPASMLQALNEQRSLFHLTNSSRTRVVIYTKFPRRLIAPVHEENTLTIRRLMIPGRQEILLAAVHLPSKRNSAPAHQDYNCRRVAQSIVRAERQYGHSRTVLVGDINMDPFEHGVVSADGLHAVMTREIARKGHRRILDKSYPFFYNPMWGRYGDTTKGPPATYYRSGSSGVEYFWHMFDQVLIRPDLLDSFSSESLDILDGCGRISFLRESGIPDRTRVSDHLPLTFDLNL